MKRQCPSSRESPGRDKGLFCDHAPAPRGAAVWGAKEKGTEPSLRGGCETHGLTHTEQDGTWQRRSSPNGRFLAMEPVLRWHVNSSLPETSITQSRPGAWQPPPEMTQVSVLLSRAASCSAPIQPVRSCQVTSSTHLCSFENIPCLVSTRIGVERRAKGWPLLLRGKRGKLWREEEGEERAACAYGGPSPGLGRRGVRAAGPRSSRSKGHSVYKPHGYIIKRDSLYHDQVW